MQWTTKHDVFAPSEISLFLSVVCISTLGLLWRKISRRAASKKHRTIPAAGCSHPLLYYWSAFVFFFHGHQTVAEAYKKYKNGRGIFKVPEVAGWHILIASPTLASEYLESNEEDLSFFEGLADMFETGNLMNLHVDGPSVNIAPLRARLRSLESEFEKIFDEAVHACSHVFPPSTEWSTVITFSRFYEVVARVINRAIIDVPNCRDQTYISILLRFIESSIKSAAILKMFPEPVRPLAAFLTKGPSRHITQVVQHLGGSIQERLGRQHREEDDDTLGLLIDKVLEGYHDLRTISLAILLLSVGGVQTSTASLTHAVYHVASNPEHAHILREEVQETVAKYGWSKASINKLRRMDSFFHEIHRFYGTVGSSTIIRKARSDFVFSDGTLIPRGSLVSIVERAANHDPANYAQPDVFNPWRFLPEQLSCRVPGMTEVRKSVDSNAGARYAKFTDTSYDLLAFGHGKCACPGRFYAALVMKTILAHLLLTYDFEAECPGSIPEPSHFGLKSLPNVTGKIRIRCRDATMSE